MFTTIIGIIFIITCIFFIPLFILIYKWLFGVKVRRYEKMVEKYKDQKRLGGVFLNLSNRFNWDPMQLQMIRSLFTFVCILSTLFLMPYPILAYILLWIFMGKPKNVEEKKGE